MAHPEELSKVAGLQKKVDEVKSIMVDNIEQVRFSGLVAMAALTAVGVSRMLPDVDLLHARACM